MFQTIGESKIISAFHLNECHKPCSLNFLLGLAEESSFWFRQITSQDAVLWRKLRNVLGLTAPFLPHDIFWASAHIRTTFCTSQSRPCDPHSGGSWAYSVVDLYKDLQGFFFLISFSWLTYMWWRHAPSYGFPRDDCDWSLGRPTLSNCWTS